MQLNEDAKMKTGLIEDYTGATRKIVIIDETISGRYVAKCGYGELFLVSKDKVTNIKEVKDENK